MAHSRRFVGLLCSLLLAGACRVPPEDELEAAQEQIEAARRVEASQYAPELMNDAEQLLSGASLKVSEKSYEDARVLANQARVKAAAAEKAALENQAAQRQRSAAFLSSVEQQLADLKARIVSIPKGREAARLRLTEQAQEAETLLQQYREKVISERFAETQDLEAALQQKLQQAAADLDAGAEIENLKKETGKKAP